MSLLLDALKKAADDKQKASLEGAASTGLTEADAVATTSVTNETTQKNETEADVATASDSAKELALDPIETDTAESGEIAALKDQMKSATETAQLKLESEPAADVQKNSEKEKKAASYTVSDEALSMLIYKTNRDVKKNKRLLILSVLLITSVILVGGGIYYYMDMQAEIDSLERKHQIAMQSMRLKTTQQGGPEKSKIIRNLVGDADLDDKVEYAKKQLAKEKKSQQMKRRVANQQAKNKTALAAATVSFEKTNKVDLVAEKLEAAWLAYDSAKYPRAKTLYTEVLRAEKNNRDALLGLGAIAVIEKDNTAARNIYIKLLKQDPRDPIASAALASLREDNASNEADEKYFLDMLKKTPADAHLNFALGNIYAQKNNWKSAQQSYFSAWQSDNKNADYIFNLAVSMDQLGKQKQALTFYQDSLNKAGSKQVGFSRMAVEKRITELSESEQ